MEKILLSRRLAFITSLILVTILVTGTVIYSLIIHENTVNLLVKYTNLLIPPVIDGDFSEWKQFMNKLKIHPSINIDGFIYDWYTEYYTLETDRVIRYRLPEISKNTMVVNESNNFYLYYKGEFIWFDRVSDVRTGFENYTFIDLVEFRVTGNSDYIYMLVRVRDLTNVGDPSNPSLLLSILIDIDMNPLNGSRTTIDSSTNVSNYAYWDYQIVIDLTNPSVKPIEVIHGDGKNMKNNGSPLDILNPQYVDISSNKSLFVCNPATDSVEISIAWSDLKVTNPWNISNIRFYVLTFIGNGYGVPYTNLTGSQVLDAVSSKVTDTEISDQVIDYWIDVGFTIACEPTYYNHYILDDKGLIQAFTDLSSDYRTDYIPNEAFDVDLLTIITWIDQPNNLLYVFIHIKGIAKPLNNISPAIAIVIDTTPLDINDGADSWIHVPQGMVNVEPGKSYVNLTETELGVPKTWNIPQRSAKWTNIIWIVSKVENSVEKYYIYTYDGTIRYVSNITIKASEHFIEAHVPLDTVYQLLGTRAFRIEVLTYAYVLETSLMPNISTNTLLDINGSNAYDSLSPYHTYSSNGVEVINGKPYAIYGEFFDTDYDPGNDLITGNGDHWVDSFNTRKYNVRIRDLALYHRTFDSDDLIEVGESAWINATIEYFNGLYWEPLVDENVSFYLVCNTTFKSISIGSNRSDVNGSLYLFLDDIAGRVKSGYYYLEAVFTPSGGEQYLYPLVVNRTKTVYAIFAQPFTRAMNEPLYLPYVLVTLVIVALILKTRRIFTK